MLTSVLIRLETPIDVLQSLDLLARYTSPSRRPLVSFVRATLAHAADVYQRHTANGAARTRAERKNIQCLVWWCVAILVDSIMLRDLFRFPMVSTLFDGPNILGAALIGWFQLLILTWFFARWEARRTETDSIVSPLSIHASGANHDQSRVHCGEIMPFYRDWFFHAFQFVWICFAVSIFWFFDTYSELPAQIRTAWRGAGDAGSLSGFLRTIEPHFCWCSNAVETAGWLRVLATSDLTAIFVGIFAMLFATFNQNRISNQRVASGVNIYWWDRRISYSEWLVRLIMVALDAGLGFFLLAKVFMVSVVVYGAIELSVPYMDYFSLDGIAGMKFVTDIFQWISWFALLFGLLVIASIYLHRNLREYRLSDRFQLVIFACLVAAIAAPLFVLELHIASIRNDILAALSRSLPALNRTNLTDVAKYIKDIQTVREWPVSAISVGVQKGVVYLLISQVVVAVGQEFFGLFKAKLKGEVAKPDSGSSASHPSS